MLALANRLTDKKDFEKVRESGKVTHGAYFSLSILNRKDASPSRFGFVIPNKVIKLSSHRTKVKRAISEGLRQNMYNIAPGYDCVILPKPESERRYTSDLMKDVREMVQKAGITK